jgi:hypothetical protein
MREEEDNEEGPKARKGKKSERTVFTVWEIDKNDKPAPSTPCFESFGNPIPAIRYAHKNNKRNKRFSYVVSPRPSDNMFIAAGVKSEPWKL